jgi:hypothetical protein
MTSQYLESSPWPSINLLGASKLDENGVDYDDDRPASRTPGPGFLGSTSFSAVYQEEKSLNDLQYGTCYKSISHGAPAKRLYMPNRDS